MRKILILGGAKAQVPLIQAAKELGYYVVLCDYTTTNPGIALVDKHYQESTLDLEAVLEVARKEKVDGVISNSEPAMVNVALVAEKLGLPGNPPKSVEIMSNKALFRTFLADHGFCAPKAACYSDLESMKDGADEFRFPVIVKPVDSSGSRGINKIYEPDQFEFAYKDAIQYSRCKKIIVEEFIEKKGYQISGDGFSVDGKLVFRCFGNEYYGGYGLKNYVPLGECWPSVLSQETQERVHSELQRLITCLGMRSGAYNIEAILDKEDNIYILEMAARNGGSLIPQITQYATGVDTIKYTVMAAMGEDCSQLGLVEPKDCWCNYMVHSQKAGILEKVDISTELSQNFVEYKADCKKGDQIKAFENASDALGTMVFRFASQQEMFEKIERFQDLVKVIVNDKSDTLHVSH